MAVPLATTGSYKIVSLLARNPVVGAFSVVPSPGTAQVRLGGPVQDWRPGKVDPPHVYTLHVGKYTSTEVIDDKVAASNDAQQDVAWYLNRDEARDAYTIVTNEDMTMGWTVSSTKPDAEIAIKLIQDPPTLDQLFKIEKLEGDDV